MSSGTRPELGLNAARPEPGAGQPDRAADVGADVERGVARRGGRAGPGRRPAGRQRGVPRAARDAVPAGDAGREHPPVGHHRGPDDDGAGLGEPLDDRRAALGDDRLDPGVARRHRDPGSGEVLLDGGRHAVQRSALLAALPALGALPGRIAGRLVRAVPERVELRFGVVDDGQRRLHRLGGGEGAVGVRGAEVGGGESGDLPRVLHTSLPEVGVRVGVPAWPSAGPPATITSTGRSRSGRGRVPPGRADRRIGHAGALLARRCRWPAGGSGAPSPDGDVMFTRTGRIATGVALLALAVSACTAGSSTTPGATGGASGGSGGAAATVTIGLVAEPGEPRLHQGRRRRRSRRCSSPTSTRRWSSRTRTARSSPAWPPRGRCRTTRRPTPSTWRRTPSSATVTRSPPTTRSSRSTGSRPTGPSRSRRR